MFAQKSPSTLVLIGAIAAASFVGLAHGENATKTTAVEVVNKTIYLGLTALQADSTDPANNRSASIDVSPYNTIRVIVTFGGCTPCSGATVTVENPFVLDSFHMDPTTGSVQRVYDIPGETLNIAVANDDGVAVNQFAVRVWGRRN